MFLACRSKDGQQILRVIVFSSLKECIERIFRRLEFLSVCILGKRKNTESSNNHYERQEGR